MIKKIIKQAFTAASDWGEYDRAKAQMEEAYESPWKATRSALNKLLYNAACDGMDLTQFQGKDSPLRFEELGALVIVRHQRIPTPVEQLTTIDERIYRKKQELDVLKERRESLIAQLQIKNHEFVTSKVDTAFKRLSK